ncbi:MAG: hypothetical protein K2W82_06250 [Candidatus Obscuribacterales bacterium]|nr:hypothetical protein [Candidatus Obscuribacterales bacterium]
MKVWQSPIKLGLLFSAILLSISQVKAADGWILSQKANSGVTAGSGQTLYITANGMRTSDAKSGVNMFTNSPNWNVTIFNSQTKRFYQTPLQSWVQSFKQRSLGGKIEGGTWRKGGFGNICGVRAYEYVMDHPSAVRSTASRGRGKTLPTITAASLWVATDIVTPPQVSMIISKLYGVPDCQRIPLRVAITENGRQSIVMDTQRATKAAVADALFTVPKGFQQAKTDMEVIMDKSSMDTFDDIMRDLDAPAPAKRRR